MFYLPSRATLCSLALLAACSSSSSPAADASGNANGSGNNAGNAGSNASNAGSNGSTGNGGSKDSGRPGEAGATTGGEAGMKDAGTVPPVCNAASAPDVGKLFLQEVASVADELVMAAQPPGSSDWYLVRRRGFVDVFTAGAVKTEHFLDLSGENDDQNEGGEQGLLGLTFHPDYASNGLFYVMITPTKTSVDQVREYKRSAADPYKADPTKVRDIVVLPPSAGNHNGGTVMFGPDKLLYVGTGDGGGGCNDDKPDTPQEIKSLFGKILRLDVSKPFPHAAAGNPFDSDGDNASLVLHYGLRNPFRFGFDRVTGDLYIGDVGQDTYEEVDFAPKDSKGLNYGWADYEANVADTCSANRKLRADSVHTPPIFAAHQNPGNTTPLYKDYVSVIGGIVYRGAAIPKLQGAYFFGDYRGARMGALYHCGSTTSPVAPVRKQCAVGINEACFEAKGNADDLGQLMAIVEGNDHEMYFVGNRKTLYKVVPN